MSSGRVSTTPKAARVTHRAPAIRTSDTLHAKHLLSSGEPGIPACSRQGCPRTGSQRELRPRSLWRASLVDSASHVQALTAGGVSTPCDPTGTGPLEDCVCLPLDVASCSFLIADFPLRPFTAINHNCAGDRVESVSLPSKSLNLGVVLETTNTGRFKVFTGHVKCLKWPKSQEATGLQNDMQSGGL